MELEDSLDSDRVVVVDRCFQAFLGLLVGIEEGTVEAAR